MIEATHLKKKFGERIAVDDLSFKVDQGRIVGFLGPNGAGKTTTMRLLTSFFPADGGSAKILDLDVAENPMEARRHLGYLPENNPLYEDLEVAETLELAAHLRGISGEKKRERITYAVKSCGLKTALGRKIGELSKGFRQRVGLAQAILHDPEVLILDEPTSGLDPNQVHEVRDLIRELGREKTVLFSTHILSEAKILCDKLVIINNGRLVAEGSSEEISSGGHGSQVRFFVSLKGPAGEILSSLRKLPGVLSAEEAARNPKEPGFYFDASAKTDVREDVFNLAAEKHWPILELRKDRQDLEEIFRNLTQN